MFIDSITYEDFNGETQTQDVFFNISKVEALELEANGFSDMLQKISDSGNTVEAIKAFKDLVRLSYGVKSEDGKRFVKSTEEFEKFESSPVYDEFMMKLIGEPDYALDFVIGAFPVSEGVSKERILGELKESGITAQSLSLEE